MGKIHIKINCYSLFSNLRLAVTYLQPPCTSVCLPAHKRPTVVRLINETSKWHHGKFSKPERANR